MRTSRRPIDRKLLLASVGLAIGVALIVFAFTSSVTGNEAQGLPDAIENIAPQRDDEVLRQSQVLADLAAGYSGRLIIDGKELEVVEVQATPDVRPGEDVGSDILVTRFDTGTRILTYQPREGAPIASFATGVHQVTVIYWPIAEPERTRSFTWQFRVTA
ncbi:MAG: hypothetical protein R2715_20955 [Ilumatobacteraceae bacterium]